MTSNITYFDWLPAELCDELFSRLNAYSALMLLRIGIAMSGSQRIETMASSEERTLVSGSQRIETMASSEEHSLLSERCISAAVTFKRKLAAIVAFNAVAANLPNCSQFAEYTSNLNKWRAAIEDQAARYAICNPDADVSEAKICRLIGSNCGPLLISEYKFLRITRVGNLRSRILFAEYPKWRYFIAKCRCSPFVLKFVSFSKDMCYNLRHYALSHLISFDKLWQKISEWHHGISPGTQINAYSNKFTNVKEEANDPASIKARVDVINKYLNGTKPFLFRLSDTIMGSYSPWDYQLAYNRIANYCVNPTIENFLIFCQMTLSIIQEEHFEDLLRILWYHRAIIWPMFEKCANLFIADENAPFDILTVGQTRKFLSLCVRSYIFGDYYGMIDKSIIGINNCYYIHARLDSVVNILTNSKIRELLNNNSIAPLDEIASYWRGVGESYRTSSTPLSEVYKINMNRSDFEQYIPIIAQYSLKIKYSRSLITLYAFRRAVNQLRNQSLDKNIVINEYSLKRPEPIISQYILRGDFDVQIEQQINEMLRYFPNILLIHCDAYFDALKTGHPKYYFNVPIKKLSHLMTCRDILHFDKYFENADYFAPQYTEPPTFAK